MNAQEDQAKLGGQAISLCLAEYAVLSQKDFPESIDRAYVDARVDMLDLLFTHGEGGSFGERDKDYQAYIACRVLLSPDMEVQALREGFSLLKVTDEDYSKVDFYSEPVEELLYLREGEAFKFIKSQPFSPERIDALQFPDDP